MIPPLYVAYKEGVIWNFTEDAELAAEWLERGTIEAFQRFLPDGETVFGGA